MQTTMALRTLGDVVARSGPAITVAEDTSVTALAGALCDGRVDAVAVLAADSCALSGIVTSKDVAKCVARAMDLDVTRVAEIMTAHPAALPPDASPSDALMLMRRGAFRHVPVVQQVDGAVLGIVDVLNLAYDAIKRLQASYQMIPSRRGFEFMRAARDTIEKPTLRPIVERSGLATLSRDDSVVVACETLVREHLTAIVIVDEHGVLDGIFTCRDVAVRVVARRVNPATTRLSQVMTRNPDCASPHFTILESLQRMQACGFRHLPVVEDHSRVVIGLVDVLQLASDALVGLEGIAAARGPNSHGQYGSSRQGSFDSSAAGNKGISGIFSSLFSSTYIPHQSDEDHPGLPSRPGPSGPALPPTPTMSFHRRGHRRQNSALSHHDAYGHAAAASGANEAFSGQGVQSRRNVSMLNHRDLRMPHSHAPQHDIALASFKFRDLNNDYRRIKVPMVSESGSFDQFVIDVRRRFAGSSPVGPIKVKYIDEDGDEVLMSNDEDLASCFEDFLDSQNKTIQLRVYEVERRASSQSPSPVSSRASSVPGSPLRTHLAAGAPAGASIVPSAGAPATGLEHDSASSRMPYEARDRSAGAPLEDSLLQPPAVPKPVQLSPSVVKAMEAHAKMMDEQIADAIELYDEALKLDKQNARARGGRGAARLINGNSTGAEEDYREAIALLEAGTGGRVGDHTFDMCIVGLVEALIDQRRYEEAVSIAVRMDAKSGNTGCSDAFRDELESSSTAAREALDSEEYGEAMTLFSNALRVETAFLELVPGETARASLRLGRAKCYKAVEDFDMALEDYEAAVILESESVAAHKGCGKCLAELEQMDRALEAYERAHKLDPADDEVNNEIGIIRRMLPDPLEDKKQEIAKLGALLGGMKLPGAK